MLSFRMSFGNIKYMHLLLYGKSGNVLHLSIWVFYQFWYGNDHFMIICRFIILVNNWNGAQLSSNSCWFSPPCYCWIAPANINTDKGNLLWWLFLRWWLLLIDLVWLSLGAGIYKCTNKQVWMWRSPMSVRASVLFAPLQQQTAAGNRCAPATSVQHIHCVLFVEYWSELEGCQALVEVHTLVVCLFYWLTLMYMSHVCSLWPYSGTVFISF